MKQLEVQIMGQGYLLGCPEGGEARLHAAVQRVDAAMCKIRDAGKIRARDRIAVLAALNLAFELDEPTPASTPAPPASVSVPVPVPVPAPAGAPGDQAALAGLLQQLDRALTNDGQLL